MLGGESILVDKPLHLGELGVVDILGDIDHKGGGVSAVVLAARDKHLAVTLAVGYRNVGSRLAVLVDDRTTTLDILDALM